MRTLRLAEFVAALALLIQLVAMTLLVALRYERVVEVFYAPAMHLMALGTPEAWQVQGNILLGLMWLFGSAALNAIALGVVAAITCHFVWGGSGRATSINN